MKAHDDMPVLHQGWQPGEPVSDTTRRRRPGWAAVASVVALMAAVPVIAHALSWSPVRAELEPAFPPEAFTTLDPLPPISSPAPGIPEWDRGGPQRFPQVLPSPVRPAVPAGAAVSGPECDVDDLSIVAHGWSRWMPQNGGAVLTATNRGSVACLLAGWPTLRLEQGAVVGLDMAEVSRDPDGRQAVPRRLLLDPGHSASSVLTWRGYGTAADSHTAQRLTVRLGAGERREVTISGTEQGPAPFDLREGGRLEIAPWRPSSPELVGDG